MLDLQSGRAVAGLRRLRALSLTKDVPEALWPLTVDGFVRLVNNGNFAEAEALAAWAPPARHLAACTAACRHDALAALVVLALQEGRKAPDILARLEAARQGGLVPARMQSLTVAAFVTLVNATEYKAAKSLWPSVEALVISLRPPFEDTGRDLLFAAGMLALQSREDVHRAAILFARLRDGLLRRAADGAKLDTLFWSILRGEIIALNRLNRGAEAVEILKAVTAIHDDAPDDLSLQPEPAGP
ncbi:MAG: hypothetical protein POH28_04770 [Acidocella sp.]|nr:hypothetical protein [Acidocella sp.]